MVSFFVNNLGFISERDWVDHDDDNIGFLFLLPKFMLKKISTT